MKIKNYLILLVFLTGFVLTVNAKRIEEQDAEKVAVNHYYEKYNRFKGTISYNDIVISNIFVKEQGGEPAFYAFDIEGGGFVIVSAEDATYPVIGYSYQGNFPVNINTESGYGRFIESKVEQILYARENKIQADDFAAAAWEHLLYSSLAELNTRKGDRDVEPLVSSMWNQDFPYNIMCPEDPNGPGDHVYAGCVATCMSQVMHYWRYPETGEGSHSYWADGYGMQSADFGATNYNWTGMQNTIDHKNPFPIAELQFHAGVSVDMDYGTNGSGSFSSIVDNALRNYFRYNSAQYIEKDSYSMSDWMNILKNEIDAQHPLYYSGRSSSGGHAFVCDGYQGNDFHFNFGWSGSGNGYYSLYNVNGYSGDQACVRYFYPTESDYPYYASGATTITEKSGSITDGSGPVDAYQNNTEASWLIDPQTMLDSITEIKIEFYEFDTDVNDTLKIYDGENTDAPLLGSFSGSDIPSQIMSSGNKVLITFNSDGSGTAAGWYLEFSAKSAVYCSGLTTFTGVSEEFSDGSGNFNYNNGSNCMWRIEPEGASEITLNFSAFETEAEYDVLKVFDGTSLIAEFSGNELPESVVATSGSMFITFNTNANTSFAGWDAWYEVGNVGMEEKPAFESFKVYPNPARDQLNITFSDPENDVYELSLSGMTGNMVYHESFTDKNIEVFKKLNLGRLNPGIYILRIKAGTKAMVKRVIVE